MDTQEQPKNQVAARVIDALGGPAKTARQAKVSPAAVCQWRTNGIPDYRLELLELKNPGLDWDQLLDRKH